MLCEGGEMNDPPNKNDGEREDKMKFLSVMVHAYKQVS
jgi:hypothetical protein